MQPDLNQITDTTAQQKANTPGFLLGQQNQTSDFLNRYKGAIGGQETTANMASRIGGDLGLPALQQNSQRLQQVVSDIPSTYNAATRGFGVNNNQLQRIIGQKTSDLAPIAQKATDQYQNAQTQLNTLLGYNQTDQQKQLMPYQSEQSLLQTQLPLNYNLYNSDNERELSALIQKEQLGVTMSEGEKNRMQQLAVAEQQNSFQKEQTATANAQRPADSSYQTIGGRVKLIDNRTGAVIADLGNQAAPKTNTAANIGQYY